ncbi:MAG: hypothetical protein ACI9LY_001532 [Arenicella sp.]|jgi:hypothetical protein
MTRTNGEKGKMIAILPERAKFSIDPRDDGRFDEWYKPNLDDQNWGAILTTQPFYAQGNHIGQQGYPYQGAIWYRLDVDISKTP